MIFTAEKTLIANAKHKATPNSSSEELLSPASRHAKKTRFATTKKTSYGTLTSLSDYGTSSGTSASSSVLTYERRKDLQRLASLQYQAEFIMWQMDFEKVR